jgi:hypothetical protein
MEAPADEGANLVRPGDESARSTGSSLVYRLAAELAAIVYIALIAVIAAITGAFYVLFPELGALSHDIFTRPRGTWAGAPLLLAITPFITGVIGIFFTRALPYGYLSVLLTVGGAVAVIMALDSPIAPAISAGLLPLVLGVKSWWYPPGILLGTTLLAILSVPWKQFTLTRGALVEPSKVASSEDTTEKPPVGYYWLPALMFFVAAAVFLVEITGLRFILFPPLVVIGFEMLGHPVSCPWAKRPLMLPVACFLTAAWGLVSLNLFGVGPTAAALSMVGGVVVLRSLDLHVPPALAVALLPQVMTSPTIAYPFSVGIGTLAMALWFLTYQLLFNRG